MIQKFHVTEKGFKFEMWIIKEEKTLAKRAHENRWEHDAMWAYGNLDQCGLLEEARARKGR